MSKMRPIETAPHGPPGFLGLSDDGDGGYDGIEWLQGPQTKDGRWLDVNSHNYTRFPAKWWAPLPYEGQTDTDLDALLAAAVREGLEIAAKTTEWEPAYAIADVCGQFIREKATDETAIAGAVKRIKTPDR